MYTHTLPSTDAVQRSQIIPNHASPRIDIIARHAIARAQYDIKRELSALQLRNITDYHFLH